MKTETLLQLRETMPAFTRAGELPCAFGDYTRYYHLDFVDRFPDLEHCAGHIPSGPFQLMAQRWLQPGATHNLLIVHGYYDHTGIYDKIIAWALSRRCNVLMFDLPGHGLSTGERAVIDDFADYGRAIADVLTAVELPPLPLCGLAQSTGCSALMELARHHQWPFERTALLAPLVRPAGWFGVRLSHNLVSRFTESVGRKFNRNSSDLAFLDFIRRDPLQCHRVSMAWIGALKRWLKEFELTDLGVGRVLVIQGEKDGTVGWRYNMKAIVSLFPGSEIVYLPEAGHQLVNESEAIREQYTRELERYFFNSPKGS